MKQTSDYNPWHILAAVFGSLVVSMTGTYFIFLQHMVVKSDFSALIQEVKYIKSRQDERTIVIQDMLRTKAEITEIQGAVARLLTQHAEIQRRLDTQRNVLQRLSPKTPGLEHE